MIEIAYPDDFHHHLRDGDALKGVVNLAARGFARVVAMPNLKPPVRTLADAISYKERIMACVDQDGSNPDFQPLMTLYLTDTTTPEDVIQAKSSGVVFAAKLYPAGATTNSEFGVTSMTKVDSVLEVSSQCWVLVDQFRFVTVTFVVRLLLNW